MLRVDWLDQIVGRTEPQGLDRGLQAGLPRDQYGLRVGEPSEQFEPVAVGQIQVQQQHVGRLHGHLASRFPQRAGTACGVTLACDQCAQHARGIRLVFDNECMSHRVTSITTRGWQVIQSDPVRTSDPSLCVGRTHGRPWEKGRFAKTEPSALRCGTRIALYWPWPIQLPTPTPASSDPTPPGPYGFLLSTITLLPARAFGNGWRCMRTSSGLRRARMDTTR